MTRTSWTPLAPAVAATAFPRGRRKYHSTQTMATAPSAVTAIWADVTRPSLPHRRLHGGVDPHGVERGPDEYQRDDQEGPGEHETQRRAAFRRGGHRELDRQQPEQRRELDDGIHRD